MKLKSTVVALSVLMLTAALPLAAHADFPGQHPAYLHALTDLRDARWNLEHRAGDAAVSSDEDAAVMEIDKAIGEVKKAAFYDGKDVYETPHEDAHLNRSGRLHHAVELLRKAESDVRGEEDNPQTQGLQMRVVNHVHEALRFADHALHAAESGM